VFGGVDLPGLMRMRGPLAGPALPATSGRVGQALSPEPAADRRRTGPIDRGLSGGQHHPDQFRSPTGVGATRGQNRMTDFLGIGVLQRIRGMIVGDQSRIPLVATPLQEMTNGPWGEVE
jgi:hypothetical protein